MFTKLYLDTTNPRVAITDLFKPPIILPMLASVILHTLVYAAFTNMVSYIFTNRVLSLKINIRLLIALLIIMIGGYIARIYHVKDICKAYDNDVLKTREHTDKSFITWIFMG